jgi:hypothetical protein
MTSRIEGLVDELLRKRDDVECWDKGTPSHAEALLRESAARTALLEYVGEMEQKAKLYEILRRLNVPQFKELYMRNIKGEGRFDDLVAAIDALAQPTQEQGE